LVEGIYNISHPSGDLKALRDSWLQAGRRAQ